MWPTVGVKDLADRWRPLTESEATVAAERLGDAEAELVLQLRARGITAPVETEEWIRVYISTVVEMVRRHLMNPEGWLTESVAIDDYRRDRRRDSAGSAGLVYVTDAEIAKLIPRRRRSAFTIRLGAT